jgi:hypothetical protein
MRNHQAWRDIGLDYLKDFGIARPDRSGSNPDGTPAPPSHLHEGKQHDMLTASTG